MSRCELTGKGPVVANLVSHSKRRTKSRSYPNVQKKQLFSDSLNRLVTLRMAVSTIKAIDHMGGLDTFVLNQDDKKLSRRALAVKGKIKQRLSKKAKAE